MPEVNITNIPSSRVDFIDPRTGLMSREWYRFFLNLFNLTGAGNNPTSLDDLQVGPPSGGGESAFGTVTSVAMTVPTGLAVTGSPITSSGTLAVTYGSGYAIPTTAKQTQWDTAYSERLQWDGGATNLVAATGRVSLGATTVGGNFFTLPDPSAITFVRINADNTVSTLDAATFRTAIGAGTGGGTVTSVGGTGTVSGLTLTGTVTSSGNLTLGGTLAVTPSDFASQAANTFLAAPNGAPGTPTFRAVVAADVPTLNQNTTGTAANVTGTVAIANGGTGQTTAAAAITALAGTQTSGYYLRSNGTNTLLAAIQAADVPTLNQNTTGTAANVTGTVAIANGGTGQTTATAAFNALAPTTTKGDLIVRNGTGNVRLAVGTDTYALVADSTTATGVKWASVGASLTIANDTTTATNLYPTFLTATSGTAATLYTGNAKLLYKPSTGEYTAPAHISSNGITINSTTVSTSYTIASGTAGMSAGPMSVAGGVTVTVATGSRWVVI